MLTRRHLVRRAAALPFLPLAGGPAAAQAETRFLRIATGSVSGTYYPIAGLIAGIISQPLGARGCPPGETCGVPGLIAIAQSSEGSVANARAIQTGAVETGFAQSDVAFAAFSGTDGFAGEPPADRLRLLASLYTESVHLVAAPASGIRRPGDLAGKRVSIDTRGSGSRIAARLILDAFDLGEGDLSVLELQPARATQALRAGQIDAFFMVAGPPAAAVTELVRDGDARLVPIEGPAVERMLGRLRFLTPNKIAAGLYPELPATATLGVEAQWLVAVGLDAELIHAVTANLWSKRAQSILSEGHPTGRRISLDRALRGAAIPLHPGAERFYREAGLLP